MPCSSSISRAAWAGTRRADTSIGVLWARRDLCRSLRNRQRGLPAPLHRQAVHVQPPRRQRRRQDRLLRQGKPQHPPRLHGIQKPRGHGIRPHGRKSDGQVAHRHRLPQDVLQRQHGLRHGRLLLHDLELRIWRNLCHGVGRRGHTAQLCPEGNEGLSRHPQGRRHGEELPAEVRDPALRRRRHLFLRRPGQRNRGRHVQAQAPLRPSGQAAGRRGLQDLRHRIRREHACST